MKIYHVKCFGQNHGFGNEVIIIEDTANLSIQDRLDYAKSKNLTCVFMDKIDNVKISLDYYYPHKRSPLCLHATLGASDIWFKNNPDAKNLTIITIVKGQEIFAQKRQEKIYLTITKEDIAQAKISINQALISELLNVKDLNIKEFYIASCGSPKLCIEIANSAQLYALNPDLDLIYKWSDENQINGLYVYYKIAENTYCGRSFNHLNPALEDVATGIAAATITYHLKQSLTIYQGGNLDNKCLIITEFTDNCVKITGNVEMISAIELEDQILLENYNDSWIDKAVKEISQIKAQCCFPWLIAIEHIGSTAIKNIQAKPVIDILIGVDDIEKARLLLIPILKDMGYVFWSDNPEKDRLFLVKGMPPFGNKRTHHLHVCKFNSTKWKERLLFRDYLNTNESARLGYETLKLKLAGEFINDREKYTDGKAAFIRNTILSKINK